MVLWGKLTVPDRGLQREWWIEMVYLDENTNECKLSFKKVFWEDG